MIIERPGEPNDREHVISNIDCDRHNPDLTEEKKKVIEEAYKHISNFVPWWEKRPMFKGGIEPEKDYWERQKIEIRIKNYWNEKKDD